MAGTNKQSSSELFRRIAAFNTMVQNDYIGKFLDKFSPYAKEYESALDLVLDILRVRGFDDRRLSIEILNIVIGDSTIGAALEKGYHGALNSLESKLSIIESRQNNDSFINKLEDAVKVTISAILTSFLTCSISPYIPKRAIDKYYKNKQTPEDITLTPINIPTHILDFSNTLHVSPVSESGIYFYNTPCNPPVCYRRDDGRPEATTATEGDVKDFNAERYMIYTYDEVPMESLTEEERKSLKKVVSVTREVKVKEGEKPPRKFIYTLRPKYTAESLYKTDDMNAFIWYVANRGDNFDEEHHIAADDNTNQEGVSNVMYEYNKMAWDSRRLNARAQDTARSTAEDWNQWLASRTSWQLNDPTSDFHFEKDGKEVEDLFPIVQFEPSESYGPLEHLIVTFPEQRYVTDAGRTRSIYKFNADYLRSIKIFNWKTIIMNLLYELNGISPIPDIRFNLSLSDEIIDARLSTLILNTIMADDMEVDDSFYSFSNEDYAEALKRMELRKYGAKPYDTAGGPAIQNPANLALDAMNETSTAATLNEIHSTLTRGVYSVAGSSGSTGITKTTLSADLAFESNFIYELLMAIVKPFIRALLSPQIMLLFCINLDTMGLINLEDLGRGDFDAIQDFIFRKIAGIIKKLIIQIKDAIVRYLLEVVRREIKKLIDEVIILLLLEQLDDYIRLLNQILECIRMFGIGKTISGIDEVDYADIIPEAKTPENNRRT